MAGKLKKKSEAISGMHMPSGENMWASPTVGNADDKAEGCKTPESKFHITIKPNEIGGIVELPFDTNLSEDEAKEMEDKIHDALEDVLAPLFDKEAMGLTSVPGEQQKDYQFEQDHHIKSPGNEGVIDVESVVDLPPMNNSDDSKSENTMEELLEDLMEKLESRGHSRYASIIKKSQTSVNYSGETHQRVETAKFAAQKLASTTGISSDWVRFIHSLITPRSINDISLSWVKGWIAVASLWRDMSKAQLKFSQYKGGKVVHPSKQEWAQVGAALQGWNENDSPAAAFSKMLQMDKEYAGGEISSMISSNPGEYIQTMPTGDLGNVGEDFRGGNAVKLQREDPNKGSSPAQQASRGPSKYRFSSEDDAERSRVKAIQTAIGAKSDGYWGANTDKAWQDKHGEIPESLEAAEALVRGVEDVPEGAPEEVPGQTPEAAPETPETEGEQEGEGEGMRIQITDPDKKRRIMKALKLDELPDPEDAWSRWAAQSFELYQGPIESRSGRQIAIADFGSNLEEWPDIRYDGVASEDGGKSWTTTNLSRKERRDLELRGKDNRALRQELRRENRPSNLRSDQRSERREDRQRGRIQERETRRKERAARRQNAEDGDLDRATARMNRLNALRKISSKLK